MEKKLKKIGFLSIGSFVLCYLMCVIFTGQTTIPEMSELTKSILFFCWLILTLIAASHVGFEEEK